MPLNGNISANYLQQTFLLKEDKVAGPLRFVTSTDGAKLQKISRATLDSLDAEKEILYTTGLGLAGKDIPLRLPAVIVPTLKVLERLKEAGINPPSYLVYQATDFISETNDIPESVANNTSMLMKRYLEKYVEIMHPQLMENVQFRFGKEAFIDKKSIHAVVNIIREKIQNHDGLRMLMEKFASYREHNGKPIGSEMPYAAANAAFNGSIEEHYPFANVASGVRHIVPIGGRREDPFFKLSSFLKDERETEIMPMLQRAGENPTYYPYKNGDILDAKECEPTIIEQLPPSIRYDFDVLQSDGATPGTIRDIVKSL